MTKYCILTDEQANELVIALAPLARIARAYHENDLDDEARKWCEPLSGERVYDTTPPDLIELYNGRGGTRLLTLADVLHAKTAYDDLCKAPVVHDHTMMPPDPHETWKEAMASALENSKSSDVFEDVYHALRKVIANHGVRKGIGRLPDETDDEYINFLKKELEKK